MQEQPQEGNSGHGGNGAAGPGFKTRTAGRKALNGSGGHGAEEYSPDWLAQEVPLKPPIEKQTFVIDGFIAAPGITIISGQPGAGKSMALASLCALVAGLPTPSSFGLQRPRLRRQVIYLAEAPTQIMSALAAMAAAAEQEGERVCWDDIGKWFHLSESRRIAGPLLVQRLKQLAAGRSWMNEHGYEVMPLIVVDTTSANIDVEDESSNSEVGKVMASIREAFPNNPVWLIAHMAKAAGNEGGLGAAARGAGAWGGDAGQTLVHRLADDKNTSGNRLTERLKTRFEATIDSIEWEFGLAEIEVYDPVEDQHYFEKRGYAIPKTVVSAGGKQERSGEIADEKRRREIDDAAKRILRAIKDEIKGGRLVNKRRARAVVKIGKDIADEALERLIDDGMVLLVSFDELLEQAPELLEKKSGAKPTFIFPADDSLALSISLIRQARAHAGREAD